MKKATYVVLSAFLLSACSNVQTALTPRGHNHYDIVATADSALQAKEGAVKRATEVCVESSKTLQIGDTSIAKLDDYKATMTFDCI